MTRIVLTISDSMDNEDIAHMVEAGVSCFRLNSAHLTGQRLSWISRSIRNFTGRSERELRVFIDLPGTKARLWSSPHRRLPVRPGDRLTIQFRWQPKEEGSKTLTMTGREVFDAVEPEMVLSVTRRGHVRLKVDGRDRGSLSTVALSAGYIGWGYHVVIEGTYVPATKPSEADNRMLPYVLSAAPDFICPSFVDTPAIVNSVRTAAAERRSKILAKIESPVGLANLDAILQVCDGAIVGRDDLSTWFSQDRIREETKRVICQCQKRRLIAVPASNYFSGLCHGETLSADDRRDLASVLKLGPDFIYCNETNRSNCWRQVVSVAEELGLL